MAAILLVAAYFRWVNIGDGLLGADDSVVTLLAFKVARYGQTIPLGQMSSVGLPQSPFNIYLYAIPYLISPDPRLARMFTGAMNVVAVALTYLIGKRYLGRRAALVSIALYAVHPEALVAGRGIWIQNITAPFVMLYILTGLSGYYDGKLWMRVAHIPMLSLAVQCHPAAILLAPITAILIVYDWYQKPSHRPQVVVHTFVGGLIALIAFVPWGLGLRHFLQGQQIEAVLSSLPNRGIAYAVESTYTMLGGWRNNILRPIQPALTALGAIWLTARVWPPRKRLPGLVVVLAYFLVPTLALIFNVKYRGYYLWPELPNAFLIQGALVGGLFAGRSVTGWLAGLRNWRGMMNDRLLRWFAPPLVTLLIGTHIVYAFTPPESYLGHLPSLDKQIAAINLAEARARVTGRDLILLARDTGNEPPYSWEVLNEGRDARVVWHGRALPLPLSGAVMVGFADYAARPFVFSGGDIVGEYFRIVDLPPADHFNPDLAPLQPIRLANGSTLFGFLRETPDSVPVASQPWTIFLIWRVDAPSAEDYKIFVHLINERGDKYAQLDVPALPVGQQRAGETVMSQLDFQIGGGLPPAGPLFLRFGMYDSAGQAQVLDESGNAMGDYGLIQIRGQSAPLAVWDNGLSLDDLTTADPQVQGPPLVVSATWHTAKQPSVDLRARWRLLGADGAPVFETNTDIVEGKATAELRAGVFAKAQYSLRLPTDVSAGGYTLELQLVDEDGKTLGEPYRSAIEIAARNRNFEPPPMPHAVNATFGQEIELLGYDLEQSSRTLRLVLNWQALGQIARDYKYFVHVWRGGQVVAQVDSVPGNYQYYTSWWAPNEVVSETIALDLASLEAGTYTLTTGFYDPATGERLPVTLSDGTRSGDEWVTLQNVPLR